MILRKFLLLFSSVLLFGAPLFARPKVSNILSSNMVLQREKAIPIWGTANPGEKIQVSFGDQRQKTKADAEGRWRVNLPSMKADHHPRQLQIKGKDSTLVFENVVVGEVWLCSGQSNMEYSVQRNKSFLPPAKGEDVEADELKKGPQPLLRVFNQNRFGKPSSWQVADGKTIEKTSSAGFFFAKALQEKLGIPVGLITCAVGGSQIEAWTTTAMYEKYPFFAEELQKNDGKVGGHRPGNWYKAMMEPIAPYPVKGFLWYQGENNCGKRDRRYAEKFQVLVESWREAFLAPGAPFYCVLLAPHIYSDRKHNNKTFPVTAEDLPLFREEQKRGVSLVKNSDYIVVSDLVDKLTDIHPPYKWEVGARLARLALAKDYGITNLVWSGPRVSKTEAVADSVVVTFEHCAQGLKTNDGKLVNWFEIAAEDGVFHPAFAEIRGKDKVVVYLPELKKPAKVRFGWHETAMPNLVNSEGLPATPFRQ